MKPPRILDLYCGAGGASVGYHRAGFDVVGYRHGQWHVGPYVAVYGEGGGKGTVPEWQAAMGIDWTDSRKSIAEAIPPAYTQYVGHHLRARLLTESETAP